MGARPDKQRRRVPGPLWRRLADEQRKALGRRDKFLVAVLHTQPGQEMCHTASKLAPQPQLTPHGVQQRTAQHGRAGFLALQGAGQDNFKAGAARFRARAGDHASHGQHKVLADMQAQAAVSGSDFAGFRTPMVGREDLFWRGVTEARSRVADPEPDRPPPGLPSTGDSSRLDDNLTLPGELDGIPHQVVEQLPDQTGIAGPVPGQIRDAPPGTNGFFSRGQPAYD